VAAALRLAPSADPRIPDVQRRLAASDLMRMGGAVVTSLTNEATVIALRDEALALWDSAQTVYVAEPRDEDRKRGDPDRWLDWATGGPALRRFYGRGDVLHLLGRLTGIAWEPSGDQGMYSYYRRPGQYLGLHRDIDACDLAIITCVHDAVPVDPGGSGTLCLYPERIAEPLSRIRATPDRGRVYLRLPVSRSLILLGGMIPHTLLPVIPGHVRIVAPLCYIARR
jgi:hypothetical protein